MADLRIVDAPEIPTENITGEEKLPTGGNGNYSISLDSLADYTKTKKDLADNTSVDGKVNGVRQELDTHIEDSTNPHQVTKGQVGLGNVDNTADLDKPLSNSTQAAIISAVTPKANTADVYTKSETYTKQESSDLVNNSISTALIPVNSSLDLAKRGIANRYDPLLTYNSGERVVLTNGDIVKSTIDGNTNNPNTDMTGWVKTNSAGQIFDASGLSQQEWNNGVESIADLIAIPDPKNGSRIFVKGLQGGWFEYNASKSALNDGGTVFSGWVRYTLETTTKPEWFGSPRNGVDDDAEGIRKAVEYLKSRGGGTLFFTKDVNKYQAKSVDSNNSAFTIDSSDITLEFESDTTEISAQIVMGSICYLNEFIYNFTIKQGRFNANNKANFALNTNPLYYTPLITIESASFRNAIDTCLYLQTYVGTLTKVNTFGGKCGIRIRPATSGGSIITSLTLMNCYALNFSEFGYDLSIACYCSLISCAADNSTDGIAYRLNMRGGAMIGCGAEHVKQPIQFVSFRGVSIQGFYCQRVGTTDPLNPQPHLIEFVTGTNATLSGLLIENQTGYYFDKILAITTPNYGSECVTVTDRSVLRSQISFVPNFEFGTRPIKLLIDDATQKDRTVNIANMTEFRDFIRTYLTEYTLNHVLTIQLTNGTYNFGTIVSTLNKLTDGGEVIIQGNASDRTLVKLETEYNRLVISRCSAKVRLKNLTLSANATNNANERLIVDNSKSVYLDNVLISKNGVNVGIGVRAINGSTVYITNGTVADSSSFAQGIFVKDATSRFVMDAASAAPTTLNWSAGMTVENTNPTTHLGWVFSAGAWKTYGTIS